MIKKFLTGSKRKTILLIGATGTFGSHIINTYADTHTIIGVARRVPTTPHPKVTYIQADIVTETDKIFSALAIDTVDVVIHNAVSGQLSKLEERNRFSFEVEVLTNIAAPLDFNNQVIARWKQAKVSTNQKRNRAFIFVSSTASLQFYEEPGWGTYAGLKSAINFIAKQTNLEFTEYGIRTYIVAPYYLSDADTLKTSLKEIGRCIDGTVPSGEVRCIWGQKVLIQADEASFKPDTTGDTSP